MVEWKKLGDICEKTSNIKWKDQADDKIYKYIDLSSVSLDSHKVIVTTDVCKQNAPSRAQQIVCANDILLGTTRPTLKRYCQIPSYLDKNICSTGFCIFRANKEYVLSRWLFHNIGSSKFWDYCELKQQGAGYPCLSNSDAFAYMIPIPSIEEQNRIVGILDTFTASIDNLKEQIAQRRKQYEYYRDQLLDLEGKEGVEMKKLSCIAEIGTGSSNTQDELEKGKYPFFVRSQIVRWKNEYEFDETAIITSGDGVGVGQDVLAGGVFGIPRQYLGPEVGQGTEDKGCVDRFGTELLVDKQERQYQQDDVDDHNQGTERDVDAYPLEYLGQHNRKARYGADDKLAGHQEVVDGSRCDGHAKGHDNQFFPKLPSTHVLDEVNQCLFDVHIVCF